MAYVREALELEDTLKNYESRSLTGWFTSNYSFFFSFIAWHNITLQVIQAPLNVLCYHFRKYFSSIRPARTGKLGSLFDTLGNC